MYRRFVQVCAIGVLALMQKCWIGETFCKFHDFHGLKLSYLVFMWTIIKEMIQCKEKHMLTDYFSCYKLNNKSTPFQEEKNSPKLKDCQFSL